jgi:hypothetical protein
LCRKGLWSGDFRKHGLSLGIVTHFQEQIGTAPPAGGFVLGVNIAWFLFALHIET